MKITQEQFNLFKEECERLVKEFQLNDWDVYYRLEKCGDGEAQCRIVPEGNASISLSTEIDFADKDVNEYLKILAKHEVIHCLIGRFSSLAKDRYINEGELDMEEEHLVRKLVNIIK